MQNKSQSSKLYETKDLFIASVLYACGQALSSSAWSEGKCYFRFENASQCEQIVGEYYQSKTNMPAKKLIDALKTIKGIIHSNN